MSNNSTLRSNLIRLAHTTNEPELRNHLLTILAAGGPKPEVKGLADTYQKWQEGFLAFGWDVAHHPVISKDHKAMSFYHAGDLDGLCEYLDQNYYWCPARQGLSNKTAAGYLPTPVRNQVKQIAKASLGNEDQSAINLVFDFRDKSDAEYAAKKIRALGVTLAIKPSDYNDGEYTMFIRGYTKPAQP